MKSGDKQTHAINVNVVGGAEPLISSMSAENDSKNELQSATEQYKIAQRALKTTTAQLLSDRQRNYCKDGALIAAGCVPISLFAVIASALSGVYYGGARAGSEIIADIVGHVENAGCSMTGVNCTNLPLDECTGVRALVCGLQNEYPSAATDLSQSFKSFLAMAAIALLLLALLVKKGYDRGLDTSARLSRARSEANPTLRKLQHAERAAFKAEIAARTAAGKYAAAESKDNVSVGSDHNFVIQVAAEPTSPSKSP